MSPLFPGPASCREASLLSHPVFSPFSISGWKGVEKSLQVGTNSSCICSPQGCYTHASPLLAFSKVFKALDEFFLYFCMAPSSLPILSHKLLFMSHLFLGIQPFLRFQAFGFPVTSACWWTQEKVWFCGHLTSLLMLGWERHYFKLSL